MKRKITQALLAGAFVCALAGRAHIGTEVAQQAECRKSVRMMAEQAAFYTIRPEKMKAEVEPNVVPVTASADITEEELQEEWESVTYDISVGSKFKSFTYHRSFGKNTSQYKLQEIAYTGDFGIRMVDGRYCAATGTRFGMEIGQYYDIVLENGTVIPCVLSDVKAPEDTDSSNTATLENGCISEFTVDRKALPRNVKRAGSLSKATDEWDSKACQIIVYEKNALE